MTTHVSRRRFVATGARTAFGAALLPSEKPFDDLDRLLVERMREAGVPGASMVVIQNARPVWRRDMGVVDAESKRKVSEATLFEAASVSKTVFAYAVMQLVDRGRLDLDAPLSTYTPLRILDADPRIDRITARHLLSHTSGLQNFRSSSEPLRIAFAPGERYLYSGEGYWYLQSVITHLAGKVDERACGGYEADLRVCATDFDAYMRTSVLRPCGMATSGYLWNERLARQVARPHGEDGAPLPKEQPTAIDAARYGAMGGLHATADEYAQFLIAVIAPRRGAAFLSDAARRQMLRPHVKVDATTSWALGWQVRHTPLGDLIQHQGGHKGVQAFAAASVEKRHGYVILTNSANGWRVFYDERFGALMDGLLLS